ncbi:MAG: thiamine pyrophosphate-dependent dehydrogenase E1 component subunit alpha [Nitrososphaerales archaeon]
MKVREKADFIPIYLPEELKRIPEKISDVWRNRFMESFERIGLKKDRIIKIYERMLVARYADMKGYEMFFRGEIPGYFHSSVGQEATAFGVIEALDTEDYVITNYRGHAYYIARGGSVEKMMSEILGKATGCCKGKGGSMYIIDFSKGILYSSGIVSAPLPVAVGIALGVKIKKEQKVVVVFTGDGATNEGEFYECVNLSSIWNLPVIIVIENNRWAITSHVERMTSSYNPSLRAIGHNVPIYIVDGMDFFEVYKISRKVVEYVRETSRPCIIEALNQRYHGHTRVDPAYGIYRGREVVEWYKTNDPLLKMRLFLINMSWLDEDEISELERRAKEEVEKAVEFARKAPYPEISEAYTDVYADYSVEL